jgi:hypothetical protein
MPKKNKDEEIVYDNLYVVVDFLDINSLKEARKRLSFKLAACYSVLIYFNETNKYFPSGRFLGRDTIDAINNLERYKRHHKELTNLIKKWEKKN